MGIASFLHRRRRVLLPGAAVILLHCAALGWLSGQMHARLAVRDAEPVTVLALLLAETPQPAAAPRATPPARAPRRTRPRPVPPVPPVPPAPPEPVPDPVPAAQPPAPALADAGPGPDGGATGGAEAGQGVALRGPSDLQADAQPAQAAETANAPAAPAAPEARSYEAAVPPPADITLDVARTDADGTRWTGEALLSWRLDGARYRITAEAGIRILFARVNLVVLTSEGEVDAGGFAPQSMTEKRRGRALTATHFNRQDGRITFSASQNAYPLAAGAQDKASVPLQLAAIARGDPGQLSGNIDIQVGEDRDASVYRFIVLGQEQIDTRLGKLATWHLSRPPKPGSYSSRLDVWLAPGRHWYPVQIRNLEASGAVTTQTVNNIVMINTGS